MGMQHYLRMLLILSVGLAGLGCNRSPQNPSTSLAPTPEEIASLPSPQQSSPTRIESTLSQFQNHCQEEETAFVFAETREYWLNICGIFSPEFLVVTRKRDSTFVRLPVTDYDLEGKWFEATNAEREYALGFQGVFEGDIFFAITQLQTDQFNQTKHFRELTQQPLLQIQANLTPPSPRIPAIFSSLSGIYQDEEYTLTIEEVGTTVSYRGCTSDNQCIFIPQVATRDRDTFIWERDNSTYIFSLVGESNFYRLKILDADGIVMSDRVLSAVSKTP